MKKWNGFLALVLTVAVSQAFFNMATFFLFNTNDSACQIHGFLLYVFGIVGSQFTFYISFSIFYIVLFCKPLNVITIYWYLLALIFIPTVILGIVAVTEGYITKGSKGNCFIDTSQGASNPIVLAYEILHGLSFFGSIIVDIVTIYLVVLHPTSKNASPTDLRSFSTR